jgi:hypothetical protein
MTVTPAEGVDFSGVDGGCARTETHQIQGPEMDGAHGLPGTDVDLNVRDVVPHISRESEGIKFRVSENDAGRTIRAERVSTGSIVNKNWVKAEDSLTFSLVTPCNQI